MDVIVIELNENPGLGSEDRVDGQEVNIGIKLGDELK